MSTTTDTGQRCTGQRCIGDWILDACPIGQGSFAVVWKAIHRTTHQPAAIKEINLAKLNARLRESLESEISVLSQISHPNVVQLYEVLETNSQIFLILEYCSGGDLSQYFKAKKMISEQDVRLLMIDMAAGLAAMYQQNLVHRDLKPQNLLLSTPTDPHSLPPTLKIADFGFARALAPELMAETLCGSPLYMAPEILLSQKYDAKADLWSVGTILYEALAGRPPYTGRNQMALVHNIHAREARLPPEIAAGLSNECKTLVYSLLKRNVADRLSFEEFFAHPFLVGSGSVEKSSLRHYPQQIVGFIDTGGVSGTGNSTNTAHAAEIAAAPVSQLSEQIKPRLVTHIQAPKPLLPLVHNRTIEETRTDVGRVGGGGGAVRKDEEEDDYVLVSAANSTTTTTKLVPPLAEMPPVQESAGAIRKPSHAQPAFNSKKAPPVLPQEAFLNTTTTIQTNQDKHSTTTTAAAETPVVLDAVPWQSASRCEFLKTMATILDTLATDLDIKHQTSSSNLKGFDTIEILAQQLSLCLASFQLYALVQTRTRGGRGREEGRETDSGSDTSCHSHHSEEDTETASISDKVNSLIERADTIALALNTEISHFSSSSQNSQVYLPSPWQICHTAALKWSGEAASEELLGNYARSEKLYCRAGTVFHFLSAEAGAISSLAEFSTAVDDEGRLRRCAAAAAVRWAVCSSLAKAERD